MIAVYLRVSSRSQSLESQRLEVRIWLTNNGHNPDDAKNILWFEDFAETGTKIKRPEFDKLQKLIFAGKVKTVVVYKLDRLSRKLRDGLNTLCDWLEKDVRIVSVSQQFDFNGAMGKFIASVFFAVAEMELEMRKERQAAGIAAARARGTVFKGGKPWMAKPAVRAQRLREKGLTVKEIAKAQGVSTRAVFRRLAYYRKNKNSLVQKYRKKEFENEINEAASNREDVDQHSPEGTTERDE